MIFEHGENVGADARVHEAPAEKLAMNEDVALHLPVAPREGFWENIRHNVMQSDAGDHGVEYWCWALGATRSPTSGINVSPRDHP